MGWGWMMGLGEGMQQVGGSMLKNQMLEKLEANKEMRAEARKANTIASQKYVQRDGVWYEQDINGLGKPIDERLAPQNKIEEFGREQTKLKEEAEKRALDIKNAQQTHELNAKKLASYDEDRALERRLREAQIGSENRQYTPGAYRSGRSGSTRPTFELDGEQVTQKEAEKIVGQNMAEDGGTPASLAKYLGRTAVRRGIAGKEFNYQEAPEYANAPDDVKANADKITIAMENMAKDILSGKLSMSEAEKYWNDKGLPQVGKAMPNMIKVIKGR